MYAIQWGLIISGCISSIPALQATLMPDKSIRKFMDVLPSPSFMKLLTLMHFNQFFGLLMVYALSIFCAIFCPLVPIGYMFAVGNMVRVVYIMALIAVKGEQWETSGFKKKTVVMICVIQTVLGAVIAACTYASSVDPAYLEYESSLKATAGDKKTAYIYLVYGVSGLFAITQIPGFIAPGEVIKQYITNPKKMPSEAADKFALEFTVGFQQLILSMMQAFIVIIAALAPSTFVIALLWTILGSTNIPIFIFNIVNAEDYGFDLMPMCVFMTIIVFTTGASFISMF